MAGDTGLKPGDVHWVIGVKDAYRAATGTDADFNSVEARKWFVEKGFSVYKLAQPLHRSAVAEEAPKD
jgi:hypothetical protein